MVERFQDHYFSLSQFLDNILIACPRCGNVAHVIGRCRLSCSNCSLVLENADLAEVDLWQSTDWKCNRHSRHDETGQRHWYGLFGAVYRFHAHRCDKCGADLPGKGKRRSREQVRPKKIEVTCRHCENRQLCEIEWLPCVIPGESRDPFFGARLLLRTAVKDGEVFAYNLAHARVCIDYFGAHLRERAPDICNKNKSRKTIFTVMPVWLKSAQNRDVVVKAYNRLIEVGLDSQ